MTMQHPDARKDSADLEALSLEIAEPVCAETDPANFGEFVSRHQDCLFHRVLRLVGNVDNAREVVQETFLRAYQFRDSFNGDSRFSTWLYRIAVNTVISNRRKQRRARCLQPSADEKFRIDPPDPSGASHPSHAMEMAEEKRRVHEALSKLSPEHSVVLVMKDMEEMKYEDIAEILGVPVGTVRSRLHRARLKLRALLFEE
jgi:RNA polymerase sigma-70 factor (ECF subfamily)